MANYLQILLSSTNEMLRGDHALPTLSCLLLKVALFRQGSSGFDSSESEQNNVEIESKIAVPRSK